MERIRGFEFVTGYEDKTKLPVRSTKNSAGYDFFALEDVTIQPYYILVQREVVDEDITALIPTGVKAYMQDNEFLGLLVRSSLSKRGLILVNGEGVVDADYYNNPKNEGHIHGMFINLSDTPITIKKGEHFMQGIFQKYSLTDNDNVNAERIGGIGSTN